MSLERFLQKLPSGKITPLALLAFSLFLFNLSAKSELPEWQRIGSFIIGSLCIILCLKTFNFMPPCKERISERAAPPAIMCPRDFGYLIGIIICLLFVTLVSEDVLSSFHSKWISIGKFRYVIILLLGLPTVIHGTCRRLGILQNGKNESLTLFAFGLINSLISVCIILEFYK